jgi:hypothetical protein
MLAQLTAAVMNTGFKSPEKPTKTTDYMPSQWAKAAEPVAPIERSPDRDTRLASAMRMFFTAEGHNAG